MAKSKYTPERVKKILESLESTGIDKDAYQAVNINADTFYEWKRRHPEFSDQVAAAKNKYTVKRSQEIRSKVRRNVEEYAIKGAVETWETKETIEHSDGLVINKTKHQTVKRPAQWAIDKILGKDIAELDAIKKLVDSNWLDGSILTAIEFLLTDLNNTVRGLMNGTIDPSSIADSEDQRK